MAWVEVRLHDDCDACRQLADEAIAKARRLQIDHTAVRRRMPAAPGLPDREHAAQVQYKRVIV